MGDRERPKGITQKNVGFTKNKQWWMIWAVTEVTFKVASRKDL